MWPWIIDVKNQKTLAFLGGALAVIVGAGWTVYQEFFKTPTPNPIRVIENACGVGVGGGDVSISEINCTFGFTLADYQDALADQEAKLRDELEAASGDAARQLSLEQNIEVVRTRLGNVEQAFAARNVSFAELTQSLEEVPLDSALSSSFETARTPVRRSRLG